MDDSLAALVRQHDPDRFLTALFAPPARRDVLLTLYAFNHELARAREVASQPMLALIRLQWWREVVEGASRRHVVATPLRAAIEAKLLRPEDLLALIEARETEAEAQFETEADWRRWVLAGAGSLAVAAARALDAKQPEAARSPGAAYGVAGLLRAWPLLAAQAHCPLPLDLLAEHGLSGEAALAAPHGRETQAVLARLAEIGRGFLRQDADSTRGRAIAAVLPAVLARRDLARWPHPTPPRRGLGDRLAVALAGLRGRL